jgi:hypothetical protein
MEIVRAQGRTILRATLETLRALVRTIFRTNPEIVHAEGRRF